MEIIFAAIFFNGILCYWLAVCRMVYLSYCRDGCRQNNSECQIERAHVIFYVTQEGSELAQSHQECETSSTVFLLNEPLTV